MREAAVASRTVLFGATVNGAQRRGLGEREQRVLHALFWLVYGVALDLAKNEGGDCALVVSCIHAWRVFGQHLSLVFVLGGAYVVERC
jgi:hypothetical protein